MFELKQLSTDAVPAALEKALRYRLSTNPERLKECVAMY